MIRLALCVLSLAFSMLLGCGGNEYFRYDPNRTKFTGQPPYTDNGSGPQFGYFSGVFFFRDVCFGMSRAEVLKTLVASNSKATNETYETNLNANVRSITFKLLSSHAEIKDSDNIDMIIKEDDFKLTIISFSFLENKLKCIFIKDVNNGTGYQNASSFEIQKVFSFSNIINYNVKFVAGREVYERCGIYHSYRNEATAIWESSYKMTLERIAFEGRRLQSAYGIKYKEPTTATKYKKHSQEDNSRMPDSVDEKLKVYGRTVETLLN